VLFATGSSAIAEERSHAVCQTVNIPHQPNIPVIEATPAGY